MNKSGFYIIDKNGKIHGNKNEDGLLEPFYDFNDFKDYNKILKKMKTKKKPKKDK